MPILGYAPPGVDRPRLKAEHFVRAAFVAALAFGVMMALCMVLSLPFTHGGDSAVALWVCVALAAVAAGVVFWLVLRDCYVASLIPPAARYRSVESE